MSDTPRTDALEFTRGGMSRTEAIELARQLERELAAQSELDDEPLREMMFDYRNAATTHAENYLQRVVRWVKRNAALRAAAPEGEPSNWDSHWHQGVATPRKRIIEAHSLFPPSAAFPDGYATGHRPYSQGHVGADGKPSEACYICTLLAEIDRLEQDKRVKGVG